jgi:hypothetical protein
MVSTIIKLGIYNIPIYIASVRGEKKNHKPLIYVEKIWYQILGKKFLKKKTAFLESSRWKSNVRRFLILFQEQLVQFLYIYILEKINYYYIYSILFYLKLNLLASGQEVNMTRLSI